MHYLTSEKYTYLAGEINALYHEAAVKMGVSDSVQNILYVICEKGDQCLQSDISKLTGISRQTINSAIRKLEKDGIVYLEQGKGRNTIVCLTEKGKQFASEKIYPLYEIENKIWNEWTAEEQEQYLLLTQKYRDALKKYLNAIL
ncbi:MarR family transcriptional regulator [Drancourtella sp. An210]|nr:MarR family transcriptional regulator [Drancourtella sp. An210]